ncbi:MAG TPA: MATE family efflux transporter [Candidatus Cloacimonas sp.]|jgi:putative MATE family efflux protein|nr:hypothetical protein [Candidatus Cloacimonadota bacterium]HCX72591.1 MATE family efflux transporter [Candidatus Cloacimonas sp.]
MPPKKSTSGIDLSSGNILKNLVKLSLPIMLSNFFQTFYNLTDAFWLGKLGDSARNAVAVAGMTFPLIFFLTSFGFGFVIAGTTLVAQYKGAHQYEKMKEVVGQFIIIMSLFAAIFLSASFIFIDDILRLLNTPEVILVEAKQYISVILFGMLFMFVFISYQSFSHGLGDTVSPMKIQFVSVLINVILDPLLIFGIGFLPKLEILGAAYATLIARFIGAGVAIYFLFKKSPQIVPKLKHIIPNPPVLKKILSISIPASLGQSMTSFGILFLQGFVNSYGTMVISVYAIGSRIRSFFMMPAMGISNGLAAVIGQNLGAQKVKRAEHSVGIALKLVMPIMICGCIVLFLFGGTLTSIFIQDAAVIEAGRRMFKVMSIASCTFGLMFVMFGVFNGSGHTKPTMYINIFRLWLLRIPLVYILSGKIMEFGLFQTDFWKNILTPLSQPLAAHPYDSLWWSMLVSNVIATIVAFFVYSRGTWKKAKINQ